MTVTKLDVKCMSCKAEKTVEVQRQDLKAYEEGAHAQHAFPYLSADERELIISNICGECFDKIFADEDEEDEG
ncbi:MULTISPECIES: hypothetical protein [unclassified Paenibacillus]|nr:MULTISPECIES: hypothetical protein [unclassified Paenibacillus]MDF9845112.1 hypothetical protein [Paenibacillus sp. PastF-2]MDF9851711.1 hypothetical protein [Paenibacillus sp. PastM-2]MDH6483584.1 hypothetical protein [Paenibacillus sp. PastH-2]MDH6511011.1 hypothetical protein [Paenibacillus sp. PastM-3]